MDGSMQEAAETVVDTCLRVAPDETVLVVTDAGCYRIAEVIRDASWDVAEDVSMLEITKTGQHGKEPSNVVSAAIKEADVVVAPTTHSLSHTKARIAACEAGARVATLPGITEEIFTTSMLADYKDIRRRSEALLELLDGTDTVHVTTPRGTDLRFDVSLERWHTDTGIIHRPGEFGNLPAGECDGAPVGAEGELVIDSLVISGEELCPPGTTVVVEDNKAIDVSSESRLADAFREKKNARNIAELGIGTNPEATLIGNILQDEKVMGTCHVAFGDNTSYGGGVSSPVHWDAVLEDPTIWFDDEVIMKDGSFEVDL